VFPFVFDGVTYTSCAPEEGRPGGWCSTMTDLFDQHISGNWGYCNPQGCPTPGEGGGGGGNAPVADPTPSPVPVLTPVTPAPAPAVVEWVETQGSYCPVSPNGGRKQCNDNDLEDCKRVCMERADCGGLKYNKHPQSSDYQLYILTALACQTGETGLVPNQWFDQWRKPDGITNAPTPSPDTSVWFETKNYRCPVSVNGGRKQCNDNDLDDCKRACMERADCGGLNYNRAEATSDYQLYLLTSVDCQTGGQPLAQSTTYDYWRRPGM
jgi:hypothetical protein